MDAVAKAGAQAGDGNAPVDLGHLRRFTLGDAGLEREVLALFMDQAPATIDQLRRAGTSRDWMRAAHTLKGSARAVGAWRLAELAEEAERKGGPPGGDVGDEVLRRLDEAAAEARKHILSLARPA